ncbi:MAG: hypothetical protein IJK24_03055 [Oscillospiraceae bacterium]|nr:hypothetical protein [Oscillospiraceae bacterium]
MKYTLNQQNYADFSVYELHKLPPRSYFIPYPDRAKADAVTPLEKRYRSEKVLCLNGSWDFRFYPRPAELPDELDTDAVEFEKIQVPGCWQFQGYDRPFYLNVRYQFPFDPPRIPTTEPVGTVFSWIGFDQGIKPRWKKPKDEYNFVGVYRRTLELGPEPRRYVISFLGVASCLDLYVNGQYAGCSEGAHNTAEFDLSELLHPGENELLAVVRRWCTGSYLECQDMFRNNGIFRDVLLRIDEPADLWDIDARTEKQGETYALTLCAEAAEGTRVRFTLEGQGLSRCAEALVRNGKAQVRFEDLSVTEWNAEAPVLYNVYFETDTCCVKERIGFRTVEIQGDVFLLNGKKLKLKGVNHHDTSPTGGYTMSPEEIQRDLKLCKAFHIDTIRSSHYPPDPLLLELAEELGLYIIDENDLETHGVWAHRFPPNYDHISDDPKWEPRYLDRVARLYGRDKLHGNSCVILWSLGNESGGTCNIDAMYDWLKQRTSLPIHYESIIHCKRKAYDVGSEMYPKPEAVLAVAEHRRKEAPLNDRPYFLCEYAHAMGVGPGNVEAYWKLIYEHDNLMGGCVWEMVDHAVLHADGSYTYGGDHGEWEHDGNFCVDGLFYPDRSPSTGAHILRHIYRPLRVRHLEGSAFEIFNTTAFTPGSVYRLRFRWNDGTETELCPEVEPLSKCRVELPLGARTPEGLRVTVVATDSRTGQEVSVEQLTLEEPELPLPAVRGLPEGVSFPNGRFCLELPGGHKLTAETPSTSLWRAATDNDRDPQGSNTMRRWYGTKETVLSVKQTDTGYELRSRLTRDPLTVFEVTDSYEGTADGILVTSRLHCLRGKGTLPRFGKVFRLHKRFDRVTYFGRTGESYCDMKEQFPIGVSEALPVERMTEPNLKPQESGNRCDCQWAELTDGKTVVRFEAVDRPFELGVKPYSDKALTQMKHREDEQTTGTYVTIQAFQQGIGTGSCGPRIAPEFMWNMKEDYVLRFLIRVE